MGRYSESNQKKPQLGLVNRSGRVKSSHVGDVGIKKKKGLILEEIESLDKKNKVEQLSNEERIRRVRLKEEFEKKLKEEEIKWRQHSRCK